VSDVPAVVVEALATLGYKPHVVIVLPKKMGSKRYRAEFANERKKIVVETSELTKTRARRDEELRRAGWRVVRL
jgi:hypothetical protein